MAIGYIGGVNANFRARGTQLVDSLNRTGVWMPRRPSNAIERAPR